MRRSTQIFLLVGLVLSCTVSAFSREASWNGLITEVLKFYHVGRYSEAATVAEEALAAAENSFGSSHPNVVESLNILAILYYCQGKFGKAELCFERVLTILERTFGTSHPNVAACFNNLAMVYTVQGKYTEAELYYSYSQAIEEKAFGKNSLEIATTLSNLALLYCCQGKYSLAEGFFKRSLAIREKALGKDHPDVASFLENMRECYKMTEIAKRTKNQMPFIEREEGSTTPGVVGKIGMEEKPSKRDTLKEEEAIVPKPPEASIMISQRGLDEKVVVGAIEEDKTTQVEEKRHKDGIFGQEIVERDIQIKKKIPAKVSMRESPPASKIQGKSVKEIPQSHPLTSDTVALEGKRGPIEVTFAKTPKLKGKSVGFALNEEMAEGKRAEKIEEKVAKKDMKREEERIAQPKPHSLIATEEEVRQFLANYVEQYTQKDIDGFLSLFSPEAIHNQRDGFDEINKIYSDFFHKSRELRCRIEDTKIEIYQNGVVASGRYEVGQVLKKMRKEKVWRGDIRWILVRENGALKISLLDFKPQR